MNSANNKPEPSPENKSLFLGISRLIEQSRQKVYTVVNAEITLFVLANRKVYQ